MLPFGDSVGIIVSMSDLPPPQVPPPAPTVQPDNFARNLIVIIVLAIAAFGGYKAYESKQATEQFRQEQIQDYGRALRGD